MEGGGGRGEWLVVLGREGEKSEGGREEGKQFLHFL